MIKKLYRGLVWLFISCIYLWGCLWYEKKYLTGRYFNRRHFTKGWQWILQYWFGQKVMGRNRHIPWPSPPHVAVAVPENILFDSNDMQILHAIGCYFQGINATVTIGAGSHIAMGCGFITSNHDLENISVSAAGKPIVLGDGCWCGMNAIILPGVTLGPKTIVGAGSVVTKSFPQGYCVIAGNPARLLRTL